MKRTPVITRTLLVANLLAFLWQVDITALPRAYERGNLLAHASSHLFESVERGGVIPYEILTLEDVGYKDIVPPPFTILTAMFLHGGVGHLAMNLLFLALFGNQVEQAFGRGRFLLFYLSCGVAAALAHVLSASFFDLLRVPMVGASGAVAGALGATLLLFPRSRVLPFLPAAVKVAWFVGLWMGIQIVSALVSADAKVAFFAHLGGFATGCLFARLSRRQEEPL
jgi:membrane associated rhomboid family serine protease